MKNTQKIFTVQLKTTDTSVDTDTIANLLNSAIKDSELNENITYSIDKNVCVVFNFLDDLLTFKFFISETKEEFLNRYPYFTEYEYDFCLSEFNKDKKNALITFLENTSTPELAEPYGISPEDFSYSVGLYIKNNMTVTEQEEFLKEVASRGLKIEGY